MVLNSALRNGLGDHKRDTIPRNRRSVGKGKMGGGCFDAPLEMLNREAGLFRG